MPPGRVIQAAMAPCDVLAVADCGRWRRETGKGGLVSEGVDEPDAAVPADDAEQSDLESVEVITTVVGDDGTVVIDDLVVEVDQEGRVVATDERVEIDKSDGTVIVDETFSIADEDGQLRPIDEETTVTEP
jgi:hypothetical protein